MDLNNSPYLENDIVEKHFLNASNIYSTRKGYVHETDSFMIDYIRNNFGKRDSIIVIEIGGGSGYILDLLNQSTNFCLINCEYVPKVYCQQANPAIQLIGGNARNLPFKNNVADIIIMKNVLHHVVGDTTNQSYKYANNVIKEIFRISKDDGKIFILEEYVPYRVQSSIIFYILKFLSKFHIELKIIDLRKDVVVSYLTSLELQKLLERNQIKINYIKNIKAKLNLLLLRILLRNSGYQFIIGQKNFAEFSKSTLL